MSALAVPDLKLLSQQTKCSQESLELKFKTSLNSDDSIHAPQKACTCAAASPARPEFPRWVMSHSRAGGFVSLESCGSVHLGAQAMSCLQSLSQNLHHPLNEKHFYSSFVSSFATKIKWMWGKVRETTKLQASFHFQLGGWGHISFCFSSFRHQLPSVTGAALTLTQSLTSVL